jgi:hypothetical protein
MVFQTVISVLGTGQVARGCAIPKRLPACEPDFSVLLSSIKITEFPEHLSNSLVFKRRSVLSGLENREYGRRDLSRWRDTLYPQKLALTSPTSGGRSFGIVRLRTQAMEFVKWRTASSLRRGLHCTCAYRNSVSRAFGSILQGGNLECVGLALLQQFHLSRFDYS